MPSRTVIALASLLALTTIACVVLLVLVLQKDRHQAQVAPSLPVAGRATEPLTTKTESLDPETKVFVERLSAYLDEAQSLSRHLETFLDLREFKTKHAKVKEAFTRIPDPKPEKANLVSAYGDAKKLLAEYPVAEIDLETAMILVSAQKVGDDKSKANADKAVATLKESAQKQQVAIKAIQKRIASIR